MTTTKMRPPVWLVLLAFLLSVVPATIPWSQAQEFSSSPNPSVEERLAILEQTVLTLEKRLERVERRTLETTADTVATPASLPAAPMDQRLQSFDQRLQQLEPRTESALPEPAQRRAATPKLGAGEDGFWIQSADGRFRFRPRFQINADGRFYTSGSEATPSSFLLRRIQWILEGKLFDRFEYKFLSDLSQGRVILSDGYVDAGLGHGLKLRVGKFKSPVGLERLMSGMTTPLMERAFPTRLAPNRDQGLELFGEPWNGALTFAVGLLDGTPDGDSIDGDGDANKEVAGRVFAHPFRPTQVEALRGLGFGMAATTGDQHGNPRAPILPDFKSNGQTTFFRYRNDGTARGTTIADGQHFRIAPQAYYYWRQIGLLGEYTLSSQEIRRGNVGATMDTSAWQLTASYVLTGEEASYTGVVPARPFDPAQRHWGAVELAARYSELRLDREAFPFFADPQTTAQGAKAWAVGINWWLNRNIRLAVNYERTDFPNSGAEFGLNHEALFLHRLQLRF